MLKKWYCDACEEEHDYEFCSVKAVRDYRHERTERLAKGLTNGD